MSDWKIGLTPATTQGTPVIIGILTAQMAWKRLSRPARAAVEAAHPDRMVLAHGNTMAALKRHGFVEYENGRGWYLTDAGKVCARWCVAKESKS